MLIKQSFVLLILLCFILISTSCASSSRPAWIDNIDTVYNRAQYVAAVGFANDRATAEKAAIANLAAFFGQTIQADTTIANTYAEAVRNGVSAGWIDNIEMQNTINIGVSMELAGAEIREVWHDPNGTYYAAAVLEKRAAERLYTNMISANLNMIDNLLAMNTEEKFSLEGFSRYQFAAAVADVNTEYANLLRLIGAGVPAGLKPGDEYRLESVNITRAIPIGIRVDNDKSGRIENAFARAVTGLGFRSSRADTGGSNLRYVLDVSVTVLPVDLPQNANQFVRIELSVNLTDTNSGAVLLPYSFNTREGHTTLTEAENRAYTVAERRINQEYTAFLSDYLSRLLPQRN